MSSLEAILLLNLVYSSCRKSLVAMLQTFYNLGSQQKVFITGKAEYRNSIRDLSDLPDVADLVIAESQTKPHET